MDKNDIYEHIKFENSQIPFVLHDFNFIKGHSLGRRNWHESIEILYFTSGSAAVTSNLQKISVSEGDIAVINSNTLHDIYAETDVHFYCLIIDRGFCVGNYLDTGTIYFKTLIKDAELCSLMEQFVCEFYDLELPCRAQLLRATALRLLALLAGRYGSNELPKEPEQTTFSGIKKVLGYIHSQSGNKISLDELSKVAGLSKFYLSREFRKLIGCTIIEYVNHVRCENAKRMLLENRMSIASIALECGYPTPSYFTRTFFANVGMHPSEYREKLLNSKSSDSTAKSVSP